MSDSPWGPESLPALALAPERTFEGFLGLDWIEVTPTSARVRFQTRDNLKQPFGLLHGGIIAAVAESVASVATVHAVWADGCSAAGLRNSASFLRPITSGIVDVAALLRHRDEREWLWSLEFRDDRRRLCAIVDVMIAVRPAGSGRRAGDLVPRRGKDRESG